MASLINLHARGTDGFLEEFNDFGIEFLFYELIVIPFVIRILAFELMDRKSVLVLRKLGLPVPPAIDRHLAHVITATAINLIRLDAWWTATPPGRTRTSHLATLGAPLAA